MAMTSAATNGDTIANEIYIDAPPEQVFQALVNPELVVKWWGGQGEGRAFAVRNSNVICAPAASGEALESMVRVIPLKRSASTLRSIRRAFWCRRGPQAGRSR